MVDPRNQFGQINKENIVSCKFNDTLSKVGHGFTKIEFSKNNFNKKCVPRESEKFE